ncbi:TetR family transcriptional regulator [Streptomyces tremellae]|uniref:TetR family transcriptional regulator n=1 Tax=Streptomyces tremellae TaxID=1124239 RepID=A0ABP7G9M5_9ACTN
MPSGPTHRSPGRPRAASRREVERVVMELLQRDGYDAVSVQAMCEAAGIGRTTFFRYFQSKSGVIWYAFNDTIDSLRSHLAELPEETDLLAGVQRAVYASTREAVRSSDVWLERFRLLDTVPALQAGAYEHWESWKRVVAVHLAERTGASPENPAPLIVASACQGAFVAALRTWLSSGDADAFLDRLTRNLAVAQAPTAALRPAR